MKGLRIEIDDKSGFCFGVVRAISEAEKALAEVKDGLVKLRADFAEHRQAVATKLQPLGIADISETDISSLIETLTARLKAWQAQVKKKADIEKQIADIDSEVKRIIDDCYQKARSIIKEYEYVLHSCANLLIEKEKIGQDEFEALFNAPTVTA